MNIKTLIAIMGAAGLICGLLMDSYGKDKSAGAAHQDAAFIKRAANGGMTEVELGKIAAEKGQKQEVKDFGNQMVKDHSKANDDLKTVASKMDIQVPEKVNAKHQTMIDKFSKMPAGESFDRAYVKAMVEDHETDISEFEKAESMVGNADLKKFIQDTVPVMKEHLEMVKKIEAAK